ncbi:MAG TPA: aminopeptidase P N-terminal domain-containing protein, partial [Saprospiraceae bacterium]|nr:aminopeptidase P N-terminal domain-containing protein [Saprospiraceae bacterium]
MISLFRIHLTADRVACWLCAIFLLVCSHIQLSAQSAPADYLPATFHKERRESVRKMLPENSVAVFFANPVRNRANDVDYLYHQDPDFYYLTGYTEPHSVLLIFSAVQTDRDGKKFNELVFAQSRDPHAEMWTGRRLGSDGVRQKLGIANVHDHQAFADYPINFTNFDKVLFFPFHNDVRDEGNDNADLYDLMASFRNKTNMPENFNARLQEVYSTMRNGGAQNLEDRKAQIFRMTRFDPSLRSDPLVKAFLESKDPEIAMAVVGEIPPSNLDVNSLGRIMDVLRETKSEEELVLMRKAIDVSCVGQIEVMKAMHPKMSESEIQGIHEFVFRKYGSEYEGYPSIVGAGENGCILHYIENIKPTVGTDLVLMDLGAEYHGYTADVTRTIPASGKFSPEQKAIYNLVLKAQEAGFQECKVGNDFRSTHRAAQKVIDEGLAELGIITKGQMHTYFPHGTSHYLGLDVHDRGTGGTFKAGTVITVEPGIYIPFNSPCDKKWWGIAVRIEDDILITEHGWENL